MGRIDHQQQKKKKPQKSSRRSRSMRMGHATGLVVYGLAVVVLGVGVGQRLDVATTPQVTGAQFTGPQGAVNAGDQNSQLAVKNVTTENIAVSAIQQERQSQRATDTPGNPEVQPLEMPDAVADNDARQQVATEASGNALKKVGQDRNTPTQQMTSPTEPDTIAPPAVVLVPDVNQGVLGDAQNSEAVVQPVRRVQPGTQYDPNWRVQTSKSVEKVTGDDLRNQEQSRQGSPGQGSRRETTVVSSDAAAVSAGTASKSKIPLPVRNPTRGGRSRRQVNAGNAVVKVQPIASSSAVPATPATLAIPVTPAKPAPDVWSREQIDTAVARCKAILEGINVSAKPLPPIKRGPCGAAAPIQLSSIGADPSVEIIPPAKVTCEFAQALHSWVTATLQPNARQHLGGPVTRIKILASYACRKRYGRSTGKISEHAKANALDIGSFEIEGGAKVSVLSSWGQTMVDIAKQQTKKLALQKAEELLKLQKSRIAGSGPGSGQVSQSVNVETPVAIVALKEDGVKRPKRGRLRQFDDSTAAPATKFLHDIHAGACGQFGTVLGPEANEAHRNHFHFDLIERRRRAYCE